MKVDHICVGTREIQSTTSRGLDAGDTDSVDLTPENHGPHRMNRKQTANDYQNAFKVPQLLFLTRQNLSNSYPNKCNMCLTSDAVYRIRDVDAIFRYNEKTVRKSPKIRNYSTQSMDN